MAKIKHNSYVLFFYNDSKKWLVKISKNVDLNKSYKKLSSMISKIEK